MKKEKKAAGEKAAGFAAGDLVRPVLPRAGYLARPEYLVDFVAGGALRLSVPSAGVVVHNVDPEDVEKV